MRALNNVTTTDDYTEASRVDQPETVKINIYVANASVFVQMSDPAPGLQHSDAWRQEVFYSPGHYNFARKINGARVRSAVAGTPAQVTIELLNAND